MKITEFQKFKGVFKIELDPKKDERGYFMRTYDENIFAELGIQHHWLQENHSRSIKKGIIRGLHFQMPPYCENKLVRCVRGKIFDVFVDLRKNSATFGKWGSIQLSEENDFMALVPRGFAHGFCTISEICDVLYKVDNVYSPEHECGLLWNDPDLAIAWPIAQPFLSEKDTRNLTMREFIRKYKYIDLKDQS